MLSQNLAFPRDLTTVNTAPLPPLSRRLRRGGRQSRLPRLSPARISLYTLFVIPRKGAIWLLFRCTTSPLSLSLLSVHSLRANIRSFKSRTHAALHHRGSTGKEPRGGSYWTTAAAAPTNGCCSIQIPIAKRGVTLSLSLSSAQVPTPPRIPHRWIGRRRPPKHSHTLSSLPRPDRN